MTLRTVRVSILTLLAFAGWFVGGCVSARAGESATTVLLVRHAEKAAEPAEDPPLSAAGQQRVAALGRMLAEAGVTRVFASDKRRTRDTVTLLAERLGLQVEIVPAKDTAALVAAIRSRLGGVVLVAGHSNTLGAIVEELGAPAPPPIADDDYDNLYIVTIPLTGPVTLLRLRWAP